MMLVAGAGAASPDDLWGSVCRSWFFKDELALLGQTERAGLMSNVVAQEVLNGVEAVKSDASNSARLNSLSREAAVCLEQLGFSVQQSVNAETVVSASGDQGPALLEGLTAKENAHRRAFHSEVQGLRYAAFEVELDAALARERASPARVDAEDQWRLSETTEQAQAQLEAMRAFADAGGDKAQPFLGGLLLTLRAQLDSERGSIGWKLPSPAIVERGHDFVADTLDLIVVQMHCHVILHDNDNKADQAVTFVLHPQLSDPRIRRHLAIIERITAAGQPASGSFTSPMDTIVRVNRDGHMDPPLPRTIVDVIRSTCHIL